MKFIIKTQYGNTYQDQIDSILVRNRDGEVVILDHHAPIIIHISNGYVKLSAKENTSFVVLESAVLEYKEEVVYILAVEAQIAKHLLRHKQHLIK